QATQDMSGALADANAEAQKTAESFLLVDTASTKVGESGSYLEAILRPLDAALADHADNLVEVATAAGKASQAELDYQSAINAAKSAVDTTVGDLAATVQAYRDAEKGGKGL